MTKYAGKTLRLNMPQWQGGNDPGYFFGSQLLAWLAPAPDGPVEDVPVREPQPGETLVAERGIVGRAAVTRQAQAARVAIEKHRPDRIVTIGGDCLVDLAPMAYLNERYGGRLGVLWVDSHPDVMAPEHYAHAHAHVLGALLGRGDPDLTREVRIPVLSSRVMYAGLVVNAGHIVGLALLFGAIVPLDLRLIGFCRRVPIDALARMLLPVAIAGLALAVLTGGLLFSVSAVKYAGMTVFQAKLLLILAALANALLLHRAAAWAVHHDEEMQGTTPRLRLAGGLSIGCWLAAIFAGRMIGYLD